jgi:type 1 glutamine amidotransferase
MWFPRSAVRRLAGPLTVAAMLVPAAAIATPTEPDPIKVLVFNKPFGFSHTDSINKGAAFLDALDGEEFLVDVTVDHRDLDRENLARYDVLLWNNSTGEVPADTDKEGLLDFVRSGKGFVGIHSAADSNYSWPEFGELTGGYYDGHWYRFGGITPEPYRLKLVKEDPDNPLLAGVPPTYDSYDETYKWQVDVRPDVHVLMSMDNASIGAQGAIYPYRQPLTWCRPFGEGRTFYTNLGHDGALWSDKVFTGMVLNALRYTGGRLEADCSVPADPATGVTGAQRLSAVWADEVKGAVTRASTYSGGSAVLSRIEPGKASVTYADVDLSGVKAIDVFATAQTIADPGTIALTGTPPQQRITPATGGTVEIRLGSASGPVLGTVAIPPAPGLLATTTLPKEADPVLGVTGPIASWQKLTASIAPTDGVHDLVLTFPAGPLNSVVPADRNFIGSLHWIRPAR